MTRLQFADGASRYGREVQLSLCVIKHKAMTAYAEVAI